MEFERYLSGELLYGDDFDERDIAEWHVDEKEGYANLGAGNAETYRYCYHALNWWHAFRHLPSGRFSHALGFGSAYGDEFKPLASRIDALTIVDPSDAFTRETVHGIPARYVKPEVGGRLPFELGSFDLISCLGVLHHIPNVSFVLGEIARVLMPGAHLVLREPIISLGDWRKPRPGLTKHERGIPLKILRKLAVGHRLDIVREGICDFPPVPRAFQTLLDGYNSRLAVWIDALCCAGLRWNMRYHARTTLQRFRPTSVFMLLRKQEDHVRQSGLC